MGAALCHTVAGLVAEDSRHCKGSAGAEVFDTEMGAEASALFGEKLEASQRGCSDGEVQIDSTKGAWEQVGAA